MDMNKYDVEWLPVDYLMPYENNAKKHPQEQVDRIAKSIRDFGFRQNLVVDADGCVIIGHGRLLAAKQLGLDRVPCLRIEDLTEEQIKALRLADNKVALEILKKGEQKSSGKKKGSTGSKTKGK